MLRHFRVPLSWIGVPETFNFHKLKQVLLIFCPLKMRFTYWKNLDMWMFVKLIKPTWTLEQEVNQKKPQFLPSWHFLTANQRPNFKCKQSAHSHMASPECLVCSMKRFCHPPSLCAASNRMICSFHPFCFHGTTEDKPQSVQFKGAAGCLRSMKTQIIKAQMSVSHRIFLRRNQFSCKWGA